MAGQYSKAKYGYTSQKEYYSRLRGWRVVKKTFLIQMKAKYTAA